MRSGIQFYGYLGDELAAQIGKISLMLRLIPDNGDELWSCHAVVRGFKQAMDLPYRVVDGFFPSKGSCHSWLEVPKPDPTVRGGLALDILPMGAHGGPILSDLSPYAPWGPLYIEDAEFYAPRKDHIDAQTARFVDAYWAVHSKIY